jgi:hypothetical protein
MDVIELFGSDVSKIRLIDANFAIFEGDNQFMIPRIDDRGLIVDVKVDLPRVGIKRLNCKYNDGLQQLIAIEAVIGARQGFQHQRP